VNRGEIRVATKVVIGANAARVAAMRMTIVG
jgi:hypothetical protein